MWERACNRLDASIHAVIMKSQTAEGLDVWQTIGTAFTIATDPRPLLLTNAHVVADVNNNPIANQDSLALALFTPNGGANKAGFYVVALFPDIDMAILHASDEVKQTKAVTFTGLKSLPVGSAVAAWGFPLPDPPELTLEGSATLNVQRKLTTGYISSWKSNLRLGQTPMNLIHYEINMFAYPGISGAPVFNIEGKVIGMNRGNRLTALPLELQTSTEKLSFMVQQYAAYSYAVQTKDIIEVLDKCNVAVLAERKAKRQ